MLYVAAFVAGMILALSRKARRFAVYVFAAFGVLALLSLAFA